MCGGGGTRLWPLSRLNCPKQFAHLSKDQTRLTLFQQTLVRNSELTDEFLVVVGQNQLHLAQDQAEALNLSQNIIYLAEPFGRNTAAVIALACQLFADEDHILVVPSDHYVANTENYLLTIAKARSFLDQNKITLFGIQPNRPETGFGYIEFEQHNVLSFQEKPNLTTAEIYVKSGRYLWNGGIFAFKNHTMKKEMQMHLPQTLKVAQTLQAKTKVITIPDTLMQQFENISIDYGVIEKSKNLAILNASNWAWSDLGSFEALAAMTEEIASLNPLNASELPTSPSNIHTIDSQNNFVISDKEVVLIGQNNLVVIDTGDALLISSKGQSSQVKDVLPHLSNSDLTINHLTVRRPWGSYTVLEDGLNYKVKSIVVKPMKRLSLQKHKFRSEVWTVVKGVATVTIDEKTYDLNINESCFIPQGSVHRLTNQTSNDIEIIEIQTGQSFDESDIVRLQDDFNRV